MTSGDYVLLIYIFLLVPAMLVGFGFARRHLFVPHHKLTMTTITVINWVLILIVMVVTYRAAVEPDLPQNLRLAAGLVPTIHGLLGLTAQTIATYLVIRMWFENQLPDWFKVKNIKTYMRFTLGLWLTTAVFGLLTWAVLHHGFLSNPAQTSRGGASPAATVASTEADTGVPASTEAATIAAIPVSTQDATQSVTPLKIVQTAEGTITPAQTKEATTASIQTKAPTSVPPKPVIATPASTKQATPARTPDTSS